MEGIKKLLSAQTAGLPNWAWLLIIAGGVTAAIVVPKFFKGFGSTSSTDTGTSTDTSGAIPTAPPSPDTSGYNPFQGGYSGGGGGTTGTTDTGTSTPAPVTPVSTQPPDTTVFPPIQPSAPAPPQSATTTKDQCKERQGCIDFHIAHDCRHLKDAKKRSECEQHWTIKCANDHPCGHSLVPAVKEDMSVWPHVRQQRRDTSVMDTSIGKGMIDGNIQ